ncbi:MAG: UDP-2,3-diacylglucosamine diphosphatase LpxI [Alphaproteobacteria bacterium]|nr:UDP-2,3-diacylglucosamine diphosphatase LpxI [Alphaproteobacteria bacterium]
MSAREESRLNPIGIIAGSGTLPLLTAQGVSAAGHDVFIIALDGHADESWVQDYPHQWTRLGAAGEMIEALRARGICEIVLIGAVRRPSLAELRPDLKAASFFARYGLKALGDDGLLTAVREFLKDEGFIVRGAQEFVQTLLAPPGHIAGPTPSLELMRDIQRGIEVCQAIGAADVGQACIVQEGIVLGIEAVEGTDGLIARCANLQREGRGGVLVKMSKPQQDRALDLPTVGLQTVQKAVAAGLSGIALEAGKSFFIDREECIYAAQQAKFFIIGIEDS